MSDYSYEFDYQRNMVRFYKGDHVTLERTTEQLTEAGYGSASDFRAKANELGWTERGSKLSSLSLPNAAEQDEIDAAKCQPAHVSHVEPEREALPHFNERTPFDPFRAFLTDPETGEVAQVEYMGDVGFTKPEQGPLQRFNDGTDALHGSAFLRG